jgi:hypothetical protein
MHSHVRLDQNEETHLAENKCVEYEGIFHSFSMRFVVMFQLQKALTLEGESEKNYHLKECLKEEQVIRMVSDIQLQVHCMSSIPL